MGSKGEVEIKRIVDSEKMEVCAKRMGKGETKLEKEKLYYFIGESAQKPYIFKFLQISPPNYLYFFTKNPLWGGICNKVHS